MDNILIIYKVIINITIIMSIERKFTYLLYLITDYNPEYNINVDLRNIIFLGSGITPSKL